MACPRFEDTELGVLIGREVGHEERGIESGYSITSSARASTEGET
jgi:hypothetical protein